MFLASKKDASSETVARREHRRALPVVQFVFWVADVDEAEVVSIHYFGRGNLKKNIDLLFPAKCTTFNRSADG